MMETSRHQSSPARTQFLALGRRLASLVTPFPQHVHLHGHLLPFSARPGSKGLSENRRAATFFPSKHLGKELAACCLGVGVRGGLHRRKGDKEEMSGHYPTHGGQDMDTIQRVSLRSLKK